MVLWFTFIFTPLGPNVRVLKKFISDIGNYGEELYRAGFARNKIINVRWGEIDLIYELARYDPDLPDIIKVEGEARISLSSLE